MSSVSSTRSPLPPSHSVAFGGVGVPMASPLSPALPDSAKFSGRRRNQEIPAQKSAFRKYAWPATLMIVGSLLGLTTGFGIPIIGHLAGLVMLGWGAHKAWQEFQDSPVPSAAHSFEVEDEDEDNDDPPSYEASTLQPETHQANSFCVTCHHEQSPRNTSKNSTNKAEHHEK